MIWTSAYGRTEHVWPQLQQQYMQLKNNWQKRWRGMNVTYIQITYFCCLTYSTIRQNINSTVEGQSDLTERNATQLCLLPASCWFLASPTVLCYIPEDNTLHRLGSCLCLASILLALPFDSEDGGSMLKTSLCISIGLHSVTHQKTVLLIGSVCLLLLAVFFYLLFDPDNGGSMSVQNRLQITQCYITEDSTLHTP
jgi:hypothetical protein